MGCSSTKVGTGYRLNDPPGEEPAARPRGPPGKSGRPGRGRSNSHELAWLARRGSGDEVKRTATSATFEFGQVLGVGQTGRVRVARHKTSSKWYAIKCISNADIVRKKLGSQIKCEVTLLQRLDSPFIIGYFGAFQSQRSGGSCYVALEYAPGGELYHRLTTVNRLPLEEAKFYTVEIALALDYLHMQDLVYRDLKPDNLLIDEHGHIKLVDFGLTRSLAPDGTCNSGPAGTAQYLAPEIVATMQGRDASGKPMNTSSRKLMASGGGGRRTTHGVGVDWWALGCILYEMLEGKPPFGDSAKLPKYEIFTRIASGKFAFSKTSSKGGPASARHLISRLLQLNPRERLVFKGVESHPCFEGLDWARARRGEAPPPHVPALTRPGDTTAFPSFDKWEQGDGEEVDRSFKPVEFMVV